MIKINPNIEIELIYLNVAKSIDCSVQVLSIIECYLIMIKFGSVQNHILKETVSVISGNVTFQLKWTVPDLQRGPLVLRQY